MTITNENKRSYCVLMRMGRFTEIRLKRSFKQRVAGSSPARLTNRIDYLPTIRQNHKLSSMHELLCADIICCACIGINPESEVRYSTITRKLIVASHSIRLEQLRRSRKNTLRLLSCPYRTAIDDNSSSVCRFFRVQERSRPCKIAGLLNTISVFSIDPEVRQDGQADT